METYGKDSISGVYTLPEFLTRLKSAPVLPSNQQHIDKFTELEATHSWCGTEDEKQGEEKAYDTTLRLCRDGWLKGVRLMDEVKDKIKAPAPKVIRRQGRWQHEGAEVDMQRIWHGDLDHAFRGTHKAPGSGPTRVRILMDSIASGGEHQKTMRWRGVGALKLADLLTEAGYSVQMESVFNAKCYTTKVRYALRVIVKEYTDPADLPAIAATTIMPAFFRALQHCWGTVVAKKDRNNVAYYVERAEIEHFPDGDDGSRCFMFGQDIRNAEDATAAVVAAILELDEAHAIAA